MRHVAAARWLVTSITGWGWSCRDVSARIYLFSGHSSFLMERDFVGYLDDRRTCNNLLVADIDIGARKNHVGLSNHTLRDRVDSVISETRARASDSRW